MSGLSWNILVLIVHLIYLLSFMEVNSVRLLKNHHQKRYTEDDVCPETNKTREEVSRCPDSIQSVNDSSKKKNCENYPKCTGQQLVYHCMIFKERFVEVCAPRTYIIGHCCPIYDEGIGRVVEDYSRPCPECAFQYYSDEIVESCVKRKNQTSIENTFPVAEENFGGKLINECNKKKGRKKRNAECKSRKNRITTDFNLRNTTQSVTTTTQYVFRILDPESDYNNNALLYVIICTVALAALSLLVILWKKNQLPVKCGNENIDEYQVTIPLHGTDPIQWKTQTSFEKNAECKTIFLMY